MSEFPHTNVISDYSFFEAADAPSEYASQRSSDVPLILSDRDTLAGSLGFSKSMKGKSGGAAVSIAVSAGREEGRVRLHPKDIEAWKWICGLGANRGSRISLDRLSSPRGQVSCVIETGVDSFNPGNALSDRSIRALADAFPGHMYREAWADVAQVSGQLTQSHHDLCALADKAGAIPVATVAVRFASAERESAYRFLRKVAVVRNGVIDNAPPGCHLLDADDMLSLFSDQRLALAATEKFAADHLFLPKPQAPILPDYPSSQPPDQELATEARARLEACLSAGELGLRSQQDEYRRRLDFEISVIQKMGYSGYFLIVSEFCRWAANAGISVGPGRGSGAGSLVARVMDITAVDPVEHGLYFERFLNPDRVSLPDFDVDFAEDRIPEVFAHVRDLYGQHRVARIATYGYIRGRQALKDAAAALGLPYQEVDRVTKLYPDRDAASIAEALKVSSEFARAVNSLDGMAEACNQASHLEGLKRQRGMHAAGVVIAPSQVSDYAPVVESPDGQICTFDLKDTEACGLVKFDLLSLSTLSVLDDARAMIKDAGRELPPSIAQFATNDDATYDMLAKGDSAFTFQFDRMYQPLRTIRPRRFEDLIALNALNRPGPMAQIPVYAERKDATERGEIVDLHLPKPEHLTKDILTDTYGFMVYQEQVMAIATACAGFTLAESDMLRRAIGKKIPEQIAAAKAGFIDGCVRQSGMLAREAEDLFADIERFADYGFNKSHAVAYAQIGYVTAWYKRHHPDAWLAASIDREDTPARRDAVADEARKFGVHLALPCINRSKVTSSIESTGTRPTIRLGLGFIKGVGRGPARSILRIRDQGGPFTSPEDFIQRMGTEIKPSLIAILAEAGAFDTFGENRNSLVEILLSEQQRQISSISANKNQFTLDFGAPAPDVAKSGARRRGKSVDAAPSAMPGAKTPSALDDWPDRKGREFARLGIVLHGDIDTLLMSRAMNGVVEWQTAAGIQKFTPIGVGEAEGIARDDLSNGVASGRMALIAEIGDLKWGPGGSAYISLKTEGTRLKALVGGHSPRAMAQQMSERRADGEMVVCLVEWSLDRDGSPEFRVVEVRPLATVLFSCDPTDIRVKLQPNGALEAIQSSHRRIVEGLMVSGVAQAKSPSGIILMTDGLNRTVSPNLWTISRDEASQIGSIMGVEKVYLGKECVFGRDPARPAISARSAAVVAPH